MDIISYVECAYTGISFDGADLPERYGGLGVATSSAEECRLKCVKQPFCYHWTSIDGWRVNCYLKSGESATPRKMEEATSGSVGLRCLPGGTYLNQPY